MKGKRLKIGVLGMGTVGSELVSLVLKNSVRIEKETGTTMTIESIFVRDLSKIRTTDTTTLPMTTDILSVIDNPEIDIICECMGGSAYESTNKYLEKAICNKKNIVMASKKALAHYAGTLIDSAQKNGVHIKYDACVGGGIPIAKVLENAFKGEKIIRIMGIFNATSNFIYTNMSQSNQSFQDALKKAQEKGFAENDPSDDVDGIDSMNKLIILGLFGMNQWIRPQNLKASSFKNIELRDMQNAHELGYELKPLAMLKSTNGKAEYKIGPCLVPMQHIVANTALNFNSIMIEGEHSGEYGFYGQGAGAKPTAGAMFDDLINIIRFPEVKNTEFNTIEENQLIDYQSNLYWRFTVPNIPGVFAILSNIFAAQQINIEKIIQKDKVSNGIEIVLLTSNAKSLIISDIKQKLENERIICNAVIPFV